MVIHSMVHQRIQRLVLPLLLLVPWLSASVGCPTTDTTDTGGPPPQSTEPQPDPTAGVVTTLFALDGDPVALEDVLHDDRLCTLLVFSTAWCAVCRREQPQVERWANQHASRSRVRYVISGSAVEDARRHARDRGLDRVSNLAVVIDPVGELADHLDVRATPTLILLGPDGSHLGRTRRVDDIPHPPEPDLPGPSTRSWDLWPGEPGETATVTRLDDGRRAVAVEGRELGTTWNVMVVTDRADEATMRGILQARTDIRTFEAALSEWQTESVISRINRDAGQKPVPVGRAAYIPAMLRAAASVSEATDGAFDITWKPLGELWKRAEKAQQLPDPAELARVLEAVNWRHVTVADDTVQFTHPDTQIGVAGVAKGWIVDRAFLGMHRGSSGFEEVILNIGGDLRLSGTVRRSSQTVRIADPWHPDQTTAWLVLDTPAAIATSGAYMRYRTINGTTYGHILDPRTGYPPEFDGSVTVLTRDCAMADALATALFVMGPEDGLAFARRTDGVDAVYVTRDGLRSTLDDDTLRTNDN